MIVRAAWRMAPVLGPRAACLSAPHTRTSRFLTTKAAANRSPASSPIVCLLLGGPGAGKGTQCERLVERFDLHHLSIGELLRKELSIYHELTKVNLVVRAHTGGVLVRAHAGGVLVCAHAQALYWCAI